MKYTLENNDNHDSEKRKYNICYSFGSFNARYHVPWGMLSLALTFYDRSTVQCSKY